MIHPPSAFQQALEGRAVMEAAALLAQIPILRLTAPRGAGPVLVLPGFMADDASTWLLRKFLASLGYSASGWELGFNRGPLLRLLQSLEPRIRDLARQHGKSVQLIGWSRGGMLARELARRDVQHVRTVITMGTPIQGGVGASSIGAFTAQASGLTMAQVDEVQKVREATPILCPVHSIYSKSDGVVAWQASVDRYNPHAEHHVVQSSHVGMGSNAEVFRLLARLLARHA
jgi:Palmitoyl protein thioesterase